jgi:demethylspheroidene O-methyltransferase
VAAGTEGHAVAARPAAPVGLRERWVGLRNRLLASPRFQRWAAGFPLTRPVAARRASDLFDVCAGFVYSQVLLACVQLRLFPVLAEGPLPAADLAERLGLPLAGTLRLLKAAATLDLVEPLPGERWALGGQGAALMGNPGISAMVEHHVMLYADLADPVALLRGEPRETALGGYWPYAGAELPAGLSEERVSDYTALMSASQALVAGDVLDAFPLRESRRLLDVGGGDGTFLCTAAARWPHLQLMLFDLPPVAARARARFEREGLSARAEAFGGDLMRDPLPAGADVVSLVRVLHDHDDDAAMTILRAARAALPADGTLIIAEPMSDTPGAERVGEAYFGFYLMAMGSGRPRTPAEIGDMLGRAGFARVRLVPTRRPLQTRLMTARPA